MSRLSSKSNYQNIVEGHGELLGLDAQTVTALNTSQAGAAGADVRRTSHKAAEQKRRDSLKARFEELRVLLPPIALSSNEERRPGEGNVGGQRSGSIDPDNPNRGVSKVALLRRSNEYMGMLLERVERRDTAIEALRAKMNELRSQFGIVEDDEEVPGLDLDNIDRDEREAGTMAFCTCRLPLLSCSAFADSLLAISQTRTSPTTTNRRPRLPEKPPPLVVNLWPPTDPPSRERLARGGRRGRRGAPRRISRWR